ncbi:serine/threonine-protein kinase [Actinomadura sp. B10D3]|uniref:serine/threonine protein kinase n=1 Tax=Actinomadura sp. B10D3 TaxID=3153557 RepID=UPI00325DED9B
MPQTGPLRQGDPTTLGGYRMVRRLGEGGQGVVLLGESDAGRQVAVKLLQGRLSRDAGGWEHARKNFAKELAAAQRVDPFCTARIISADVEGDVPYIVSEYIEGHSLRDAVADYGPLAGTALNRLAIGTVTALTAIHAAGIVHRDFKPGNVILGPDGPRVIDFGVARVHDPDASMTGGVVGTPAYMAPEQLKGLRPGPAADVFAWAATVVYAATGRPPFGQDVIAAVMQRILHEEPDLRFLDGPLRSLVAVCLSKDPEHRPSAREVLMHLLGHGDLPAATGADAATALQEGTAAAAPDGVDVTAAPYTAPPSPSTQTAPARGGRGSAVVSAMVAVIVTALAGAAVAYYFWPDIKDSGSQPQRGQGEAGAQSPTRGPDVTKGKVASSKTPSDQGVTWFQNRMGLKLAPGWRAVQVEGATHVITGRCPDPKAQFLGDGGCEGFWVFGEQHISRGDEGFRPYTGKSYYFPSSGAAPCPGDPEALAKTPKAPTSRTLVPIGTGHTSDFRQWDVQCARTDGSAAISFTQREWFLPTSRILIVDRNDIPDIPSVLNEARWR